MSSRLNLNLGNVYFLRMVDPSGRYEFPYVKVGITKKDVPDRIDEMQAGNPFKIVEWNHFYSEAAQLVENYIHHAFAERRARSEWLRFDEEELPNLFDTAEAYSKEVFVRAEAVRALDIQASNGKVIEANNDTRALHKEIVTLLGAEVETKGRFEALEYRLKAMTGMAGGIEGVTKVTITGATRFFNTANFKKAEPNLYTQYCLIEDLGCSFSFLGKPQISAYPEVHTARKEAKSAVVPVAMGDVTSGMLDRSGEIENLHTEYLDLIAKLANIRRDLIRYELDLRYVCGKNEGIEGVCTYKREIEKKFDKEAFKKDHPDIWSKFETDRHGSLRFKVLPYRDYV